MKMQPTPLNLMTAILAHQDESERLVEQLIDLAKTGNLTALRYLGSLLRQQSPEYESIQQLAFAQFDLVTAELLQHTELLGEEVGERQKQVDDARITLKRLELAAALHELMEMTTAEPDLHVAHSAALHLQLHLDEAEHELNRLSMALVEWQKKED